MPTPPRVRVVVQLPYNRPDEPHPKPPHIEWNAEKANILWEVIALSRTSDNGGTDWKGLAAHLEVPLPYLLYRAQARYEEDLRGLQDIRGVLSTPAPATTSFPAAPSTPAITTPRTADTTPVIPSAHPLSIEIPPSLGARRLSGSQRVTTPLGVRARLNSLTHKSPSKARGGQGHLTHGKMSSSTATLQGTKRFIGPVRPVSPFSDEAESESSDEEELAQRKEEEMERQAEEQEHLDKKLAQLQSMMTNERLGLVKSPVSPEKGKEREDRRGEEIVRGRPQFPASANAVSAHPSGDGGVGPMPGSPSKLRFNEQTGLDVRLAEFTSAARNRDHSASVSSASSPRGSIPSIPSPSISSPSPPPVNYHAPSTHDHTHVPIQYQAQATPHLHPNSQPPSLAGSPLQRHLSPTKSSSPPAVSVRNARGHAHTRQGFGALGAAGVSEGESNHGSSASSFSDLSDASLSASALESALMSNMRGTGSKA
ncbi:hypothetical protein L210DRAFT_956816 [Boletus edulis BED1]|uniref:Autophagy-related protein 29 n=1 Tax=Boletus edulis BED1 TaxID=1328754 RepID=A0AAD4C7A3_BOLED|nr:hypothetical protein L210DRAFT_956816 [Boletus edulis BED1]